MRGWLSVKINAKTVYFEEYINYKSITILNITMKQYNFFNGY